MSCYYYNEKKESTWDGIYCDRIAGRPGVKYWDYYCKSNCNRCPYNGGDDPYELHPDTRVRKKREEDERKAKPVSEKIRSLSSYVTLDSEDEILEARSAYNSLTYDQRAYVPNESKLRQLEEQLIRVKEENKKQKTERKRQQESRIKTEEKPTYTTNNKPINYRTTKNLAGVTRKDLTDEEYYSLTLDEKLIISRNEIEQMPFLKRLKFELGMKLEWLAEYTLNPRENAPSWIIVLSRIVWVMTATLLWYYGRETTPRSVEWTFAILAWIQGVSLIVSYIVPKFVKFRLCLWAAMFIDLCILILLIYLNYNIKIIVLLLLCTFVVPLIWLLIKLCYVIGENLF